MKTSLALIVTLLAWTSPVFAQWCNDDDVVYAIVDLSTITIHHDAAFYNCCPERIDYVVNQVGNVIDVQEIEVNPQCVCMCCFNLSVDIEHVAPGDYVVNFRWYNYETAEWRTVQLNVTVPDVGQIGPIGVGEIFTSDCVDVLDIRDPEETELPTLSHSWGRVKALYR